MVHYLLTEHTVSGRRCYGITAVSEERVVDALEDVFPDFGETARLAALLQENGVAAEHFRDVVSDYLER